MISYNREFSTITSAGSRGRLHAVIHLIKICPDLLRCPYFFINTSRSCFVRVFKSSVVISSSETPKTNNTTTRHTYIRNINTPYKLPLYIERIILYRTRSCNLYFIESTVYYSLAVSTIYT